MPKLEHLMRSELRGLRDAVIFASTGAAWPCFPHTVNQARGTDRSDLCRGCNERFGPEHDTDFKLRYGASLRKLVKSKSLPLSCSSRRCLLTVP